MNNIISQINNLGYNPGQFNFDGKVHRFKVDDKDKKKSGWVICYQNHTLRSGEMFHVAVVGNFKTGKVENVQTNSVTLTREDSVIIKKQIAKAQLEEKKAREKVQEETSIEVNKTWEKLLDHGVNEYLNRKQISEVKDLNIKFDEKGNFYIPARDIDGKMWSWEKIKVDGTKRFKSGGRVKGCSHVIGKLNTEKIYFAEGFSTAASISLAINSAVVCCFSSTHMPAAVKSYRKKYPESEFYICADNDEAGLKAASEVEESCYAKIIIPERENDFNDVLVNLGKEEVSRQILGVKPPKKVALYALGYIDKEYFFTSTSNKTISSVISFTEDNFLKLMPLEYWENQFPGSTEHKRVDWTAAKTELMKLCWAKGIFDGSNIRGNGVWEDRGRIVVHRGDHLIVDGEVTDLSDIESRYFYTLGKKLYDFSDKPLSKEECMDLLNACNGFKWSKPKEAGMLLAGLLVLNRVCGALPIRPMCWITGSAQTGKTTLLDGLIKKILGDANLPFQGNTTEAGVRQSLKNDARPVLFDEFETSGPRSHENISAILELCRASWSTNAAPVVKGTANGTAMAFPLNFSAILSSIRTFLINDADKGRFTVLELAPHGSDQDHWEELSEHLAKIDYEYGDRLFARTVKMLPTILKNKKVLKDAFARKADSRFGDQYGMIMSGYASLIYDELLTKEEADELIDDLDLVEEREIAKTADHDDCLNHMLNTKINYDTSGGRKENLIINLISDVHQKVTSNYSPDCHDFEIKALNNIGVKVEDDYLAIASNHTELEKLVFRGTRWSKTWNNSLGRIEDTKRGEQIWMKPRNLKGIRIPISSIIQQS